MKLEIKKGNFNAEDSTRGWRVGHFSKDPNLKTDKTEFQWLPEIAKSASKKKAAYNKESSTLIVLVKGEMKIDFPHSKNKSVILAAQGDYVFFAPGVCHTWKATKKTTLVSIRWPSFANDQTECDHV